MTPFDCVLCTVKWYMNMDIIHIFNQLRKWSIIFNRVTSHPVTFRLLVQLFADRRLHSHVSCSLCWPEDEIFTHFWTSVMVSRNHTCFVNVRLSVLLGAGVVHWWHLLCMFWCSRIVIEAHYWLPNIWHQSNESSSCWARPWPVHQAHCAATADHPAHDSLEAMAVNKWSVQLAAWRTCG